jgi:hypothetical protein
MSCSSAHARSTERSTGNAQKRLHMTQSTQQVLEDRIQAELPTTIPISVAAQASAAIPIVRLPPSKEQSKRRQREAFLQHLRDWALNHDSSVYFKGTIQLNEDAFPDDILELGKSVNCILSSGTLRKKIVVRLFRSEWHKNNVKRDMSKTTDFRIGQYVAPYRLVIRSGSGWVQAREYFDRYYFTKSGKNQESLSQCSVSTFPWIHLPPDGHAGSAASISTWSAPPVPASTAHSMGNTQMSTLTGPTFHNGGPHVVFTGIQQSSPVILPPNNSIYNDNIRIRLADNNGSLKQSNPRFSLSTYSKLNVPTLRLRDIIPISPLFRPFLRLPQELQDEILYRSIGYTGTMSVTRTVHPRSAVLPSKAPITVSKLFRISKSMNEHFVPHIFRSTNFHFGMTGFTKFLWQIGPINRSNLRHLTFHFGIGSLLHCIRWLAPDPIWELFEPPVATNPPTLIHFWRCQLQDLLKELNLSTISIDIQDVPPRDISMVVRIVQSVIGSINRIYVISKKSRVEFLTRDYPRSVRGRIDNTRVCTNTWRELSLQYHHDYKYQRWHMQNVWTSKDEDLTPLLNLHMDKEKAFFDS